MNVFFFLILSVWGSWELFWNTSTVFEWTWKYLTGNCKSIWQFFFKRTLWLDINIRQAPNSRQSFKITIGGIYLFAMRTNISCDPSHHSCYTPRYYYGEQSCVVLFSLYILAWKWEFSMIAGYVTVYMLHRRPIAHKFRNLNRKEIQITQNSMYYICFSFTKSIHIGHRHGNMSLFSHFLSVSPNMTQTRIPKMHLTVIKQ